MPPSSLRAAQSANRNLLRQTATVYGETPTTGKYTTVLIPTLKCQLVHPSTSGAPSAAARAEMMADRDLWWDPSTVLPEQCRVRIDGVYWQPRAGTFQVTQPDGQTVVLRRCIVIRVQTTSF